LLRSLRSFGLSFVSEIISNISDRKISLENLDDSSSKNNLKTLSLSLSLSHYFRDSREKKLEFIFIFESVLVQVARRGRSFLADTRAMMSARREIGLIKSSS